jgi:hypothetical protein
MRQKLYQAKYKDKAAFMFSSFFERRGQARESPHLHSDRKVLAFDVGR